MSDLKSQIFSLLKKCPTSASSWDNGSLVLYRTGDGQEYHIETYKRKDYHPKDHPDFSATITIENERFDCETIPLTEKEFMDFKWKTEEWEKILHEKAFEAFKEFAESDPTSMDDLLND